MGLRPHQILAVDGIQEEYGNGNKSVMLCMPTGAGKSHVFAHIGERVANKGKTAMVLVNRRELLEQAEEKFKELGIQPSIIMSGYKQTHKSSIYIASVDTLKNRDYPKLSMLFVDEAHIANFRPSVNYYKEQGTHICGFSGTPVSTRAHNLSEMYQALVNPIEIPALITNGFLSTPTYYTAKTELGKINKSMGDFDNKQLFNAYDKPGVYQDCIQKFLQHASNDITMVFCVNREHTIKTFEVFIQAGINATYVVSGMPIEERKRRIKAFKAGFYQVLINCGICTTGFDYPAVSCVIVDRDTASIALWLQIVGRASRVIKGIKNTFKVIDMGSHLSRAGIGFWEEEREWSLTPPEKRSESLSIAPTKECPEPIVGVHIDLAAKHGCGATIHASLMQCPHCGFEFPKAIPKLKDDEFVEVEYRRVKMERMVATYKHKDYHKVPEDMLVEFGEKMGFKPDWAKIELARRKTGKKIVTLKGYSGDDYFVKLKEVQKYYNKDQKIPADRFVFHSENKSHINFTWVGTEIKAVENAEEAAGFVQ